MGREHLAGLLEEFHPAFCSARGRLSPRRTGLMIHSPPSLIPRYTFHTAARYHLSEPFTKKYLREKRADDLGRENRPGLRRRMWKKKNWRIRYVAKKLPRLQFYIATERFLSRAIAQSVSKTVFRSLGNCLYHCNLISPSLRNISVIVVLSKTSRKGMLLKL